MRERAELLEALHISNKNAAIPRFSQRIPLIWGEKDRLLSMELTQNMKQPPGEGITLQGTEKGGHLVHLGRRCLCNKCLKKFLTSLAGEIAKK